MWVWVHTRASGERRRCLNINKQLHDIIRGNIVGVYRGLVKKSERSPACLGLLKTKA